MDELKKLWVPDREVLNNRNGHWMTYYDDALTAIREAEEKGLLRLREAREEGAREAVERERQNIRDWCNKHNLDISVQKVMNPYEEANPARGASVKPPVCCCGSRRHDDVHAKDCPCYVEPPKKVCTCEAQGIGKPRFDIDCPRHGVAPEKPPLEHADYGKGNVLSTINALVDHVRALEEKEMRLTTAIVSAAEDAVGAWLRDSTHETSEDFDEAMGKLADLLDARKPPRRVKP